MAVIKNLAFSDKNKLKNLKSFKDAELDLNAFCPFPLDILHNILPFRWKFLTESFVAFENKKIKGLITVCKAGLKRVKITRLLLDENSLETGKQLVDYVVTTFLARGAESFYVVVDKENYPLISLFVDGLGFKNFAKEIIYEIKSKDVNFGCEDINFEYIRKMEDCDVKNVHQLICSTMNSYQKPTFYKKISELKKKFLSPIEPYIIYDKTKEKVFGYFTLLKLNKKECHIDFVIEKGFEGYAVDIVKFAQSRFSKDDKEKVLYLKLKSYYSNFSELAEIFKIEYKNAHENEILVKDFLVAKKQEFTYERMIFNDVTPAF